MIKRTPQEIADFFGCYVVQDRGSKMFNLYLHKPTISMQFGWWTDDDSIERQFPVSDVKIPSDHDWTHLYEPHSDNKSEACYADQDYSDNKSDARKEYAIVEGKRTQDIAGKVNVMLDHGWNPQGGIAVEYLPESDGYKEGSEIFYQAMVRGV